MAARKAKEAAAGIEAEQAALKANIALSERLIDESRRLLERNGKPSPNAGGRPES